jgi:hypothetical protein
VDDPAVKYLPYKSKPAGTPYAYQLQPGQTFVLAPQLGDSIPFVWPKDKLRAFTENKVRRVLLITVRGACCCYQDQDPRCAAR